MRRLFRCALTLSFLLLSLAGVAHAQSDLTVYADALGPGRATLTLRRLRSTTPARALSSARRSIR